MDQVNQVVGNVGTTVVAITSLVTLVWTIYQEIRHRIDNGTSKPQGK